MNYSFNWKWACTNYRHYITVFVGFFYSSRYLDISSRDSWHTCTEQFSWSCCFGWCGCCLCWGCCGLYFSETMIPLILNFKWWHVDNVRQFAETECVNWLWRTYLEIYNIPEIIKKVLNMDFDKCYGYGPVQN